MTLTAENIIAIVAAAVSFVTTENIIVIVAAAVSFGSMCAAIVSAATARKNAKIAEEAKRQAKQAALLERRIAECEAMERTRQAHFNVTYNRSPAIEDNLRGAMSLSKLVFSPEVQEALAQADSKARHLNNRPSDQRKEQGFQNTLNELGTELQAVFEQMNREAALDR
jgi:hypothetical protein